MNRVRAAIPIALVLASCGSDGGLVELGDGTVNVRRQALAFDGQTYAVAWTTSSELPTDDRLWFARLSPDGRIVQAPTPVDDLSERISELALVATTSHYVVWYRAANSTTNDSLFALALDEQGGIVIPETDIANVDGTDPHTFGVAVADGQFVVALQRSNGTTLETILGRYTLDLARIGEAAVETSTSSQREPTVTWSAAEQRAYVGWQERDRIRTVRVQADGTRDGVSAPVSDTGGKQYGAVLHAGDLVVVGWAEDNTDDRRQLRFASTAPTGEWRLHGLVVPKNRYQWLDPAFAVRGGRATIAWASDAETALRRIDVGQLELAAGTELENQRSLTTDLSDHDTPRVAVGTTEFALTFTGKVNGAVRLFFTTVD